MDDRERRALLASIEADARALPWWRWLRRRILERRAAKRMAEAAEMMAEHDRRW